MGMHDFFYRESTKLKWKCPEGQQKQPYEHMQNVTNGFRKSLSKSKLNDLKIL